MNSWRSLLSGPKHYPRPDESDRSLLSEAIHTPNESAPKTTMDRALYELYQEAVVVRDEAPIRTKGDGET
jgi:hypothetical protein